MPLETKRALIVVRTYPTPAKQGIEVSCTAAVTDHGEWLRLFPIPYRFLDSDKKFRKYQWIDVQVSKATDHRIESYKIENNSISIVTEPLPTDHGWRERWKVVRPLVKPSLCWLQRHRDEHQHPTLGVFKPKLIRRLIIAAEKSPQWSEGELQILRQRTLYADSAPKNELEKVPYRFSYEFVCAEPECPGHTLMCSDWELGEAWRRWHKTYADGWQAEIRKTFEAHMIEHCDLHFFVGTVHKNPKSWIIVGLFYPPKPDELPLFP